MDVHPAILPEPLRWTVHLLIPAGKLSTSRIDRLLANYVTMELVWGARVFGRGAGWWALSCPGEDHLAKACDYELEATLGTYVPDLLKLSFQELRSATIWTGWWSNGSDPLKYSWHQSHNETIQQLRYQQRCVGNSSIG